MNEALGQIQNLWNQMDTTRRVSVVVILFLVLGSIIFVAVWANRPQYQLLYSSLNEQDRSEIIAKLDEMKVAYRTTDGGGLEVPNALSVRAGLLKEGIPRGGVVGWEIFDQNSFSTTDFTNQINRQRAIAGELTRTLQNFDGILDAKIMLNLPDNSEYLFTEDKQEGTASVQLKLRSPGVLSESQTASIANLVASSTGLKQENVTIIDNFANDLTAVIRSKRNGKSGLPSTSQMFEAKTEYETTAEKRLEGMLTRVFGFNKAVVRVNAELDLDYQETKSEKWGDKGVPRSEQEKAETTTQGNGDASGIPGTSSNIPQYKTDTSQNNQYTSEKTERTANYEIDKKEELRIAAPGAVKRQTVGVWVDGNLPDDIKQKVQNTVAAAIGILEERGDRLTVETIKFTPPPQAENPRTQLNLPWQQIMLYLILAAFLGGLLVTLRKIIHVTPPQPETPVHTEQEIGVNVDTLISNQTRAEEPPPAPEISPEEKARIDRLQTLEKIALDKPEEIAALLKNWISEDY